MIKRCAFFLLAVSVLAASAQAADRRVVAGTAHVPGVPMPGINVPVPVPVPMPGVNVPVVVPSPPVVIKRKSPPAVVEIRRDDDRHGEWKHGKKWSSTHKRYRGKVYRTLPDNVVVLHLGGGTFFYNYGTFYRHSGEGYVVVEAPVGARVRVLPDDCSSLIIGHSRYVLCDDVYYERLGDEYVVLDGPPRGWRPPEARVGSEVWIDTEKLNLRAGPGRRYDVVGQLYRGEVVEIRGMEGDWYSVRLHDGGYGWVMKNYTRPYRHRLQGDG